jgi:hypothetical protein
MQQPPQSFYRNPSLLYGPITQDQLAPVPGWGMNPAWAGPPRVGVGETDDEKTKTTKVLIAGVVGILLLGGAAWWLTTQQPKRATPNKRRRRKTKRNPPYGVYATKETRVAKEPTLPQAVELADYMAKHGYLMDEGYEKSVVYDEGRMDRGPKGEFVAMFRPNKRKRRRK